MGNIGPKNIKIDTKKLLGKDSNNNGTNLGKIKTLGITKLNENSQYLKGRENFTKDGNKKNN